MPAAGRYRAEDLIELGKEILTQPGFGFKKKQATATAYILVEADLRGDPDHGIVSGDKLNEIYEKIHDDADDLGFKRICNPSDLKKSGDGDDFIRDRQKYPTLLTVDAKRLLGHYVTLEILPEIIRTAKKFGYAKAYIRNSTHFGNCGIYSEMIAENDLAAKISCTTAAWTMPFIEPQKNTNVSRNQYEGAKKRFGTNPIAWSIPYDEGIITIDMATTQRAVSPAINAANYNAAVLEIQIKPDTPTYIGKGEKKRLLEDVHPTISKLENDAAIQNALSKLGYKKNMKLRPVEKGLLKGPAGENIHYPLAFDAVFKKQFWVAPLGGTLFGYKGFGLNMLVELDNVMGGGEPGLIRRIDNRGRPLTSEGVAQTVEAYAIDMLHPLAEAKKKIGDSVRTTRRCGNELMFLPGEKEQLLRKKYGEQGIPVTTHQIKKLETIAKKAGAGFDLKPIE
jgi:LDH2 family malate/lactate/ureidoglycolate dehydrogenase